MPETVSEHDRALDCVDRDLLHTIVAESNILPDEIDLKKIVSAHRASDALKSRQINPLFDESWYLSQYKDVAEAVRLGGFESGFVHFIRFGIFEGRWPNKAMSDAAVQPDLVQPYRQEIDVEAYCRRYPAVGEFLRHFPLIDALVHYNFFGRRLGLSPDEPQPSEVVVEGQGLDAIHDAFDAEWYLARYGDEIADHGFEDDPFAHYLIEGMRKGYSPSAEFDEQFYRLF